MRRITFRIALEGATSDAEDAQLAGLELLEQLLSADESEAPLTATHAMLALYQLDQAFARLQTKGSALANTVLSLLKHVLRQWSPAQVLARNTPAQELAVLTAGVSRRRQGSSREGERSVFGGNGRNVLCLCECVKKQRLRENKEKENEIRRMRSGGKEQKTEKEKERQRGYGSVCVCERDSESERKRARWRERF